MKRLPALIRSSARRLSDALARLAPTPRERALLAGLLCAVSIAALIEAAAFAVSARSRAAESAMAQARAEAALARIRDPAHRSALDAGARQARAWSFDDATWDIASVRAQTDLDAMARASGLNDVRVIVAPSARSGGPLRLMLEATFSWEAFSALLSGLAQSSQSYAIEAVEVDEEVASLRMDVRAAYITPGPAS